MGAKQPDTAFKEVKKLVVNYPILKYYGCNASKKGLGTVILQNGQLVAFALKTLLPTKRRYTQTEKVSCNPVCLSEVQPVYILTKKNHSRI